MTIKTHGRMMTNDTIGADQLAVSDYGTDNQALVTDGAGTIRWATVGIGGSVGSSTYVENIFAGDDSKTKFQMTATAAIEESLLVFVDGVAQPTSAFTLSSSGVGIGANSQLDEINISPALATGQQLRVCHLGINTAIADGSITGAKITMGADAAGDLLYHNGTQYDRFPIGTKGQLFATNGAATAPEWILGDTAGDILFYNGTNYEKLGIGTAGQLLATNAGATAPYWLNADNQNLPAVGAAGNVLTSDASNWSSQPPLGGVGGELVSIQVFGEEVEQQSAPLGGAAQTWTKPANITRIEVFCVGGGGAASGSGGHAGGGEFARKSYDVTNITSYPVFIGVGGSAGGHVMRGGASHFAATGGTDMEPTGPNLVNARGGIEATSTANTGGGSTGVGDLVIEGGHGEYGGDGAGPYGADIGRGASGTSGNTFGGCGIVVVYEYSNASAHLVGEKLVSHQLLLTTATSAVQTWTKPAGITKIRIFVQGPGGGAKGGGGYDSAAAGGGGCSVKIQDVTNVTSVAYNVGWCGVGAGGGNVMSATSTGWDSTGLSAGNYIVIGDPGGSTNISTTVGTGGTASGGDFGINGEPGSTGGGAAGGPFGGLGQGGGHAPNSQSRPGTAGYIYVEEYSDPSLVSGGSLVPTGVVNPYAGATAPAGWLLCWGQAISRTTYSTLFTAIGTTYGVGDGSTTFLLPDMRGRVAAGQDDMGGTSANRLTTPINGDTLGAVGGSETHTTSWHGNITPPADEAVLSGSSPAKIQPTIILNYIIKT